MGYKQQLGPLRRAGYDKDATSPFHQDTDSTSGVDLAEQKRKIRDVINKQKVYDTGVKEVRRDLAEIDSLNLVEKGQEKEAKGFYGDRYTSDKSLKRSTPISGPTQQKKEKLASLTEQAREHMAKKYGPRPSVN
jgi:hypothetical protein